MKRPIEPTEIRTGDLVRAERRVGELAHEFRATSDGYTSVCEVGIYDFFLLERPEPAVELPTEPTLGFVTGNWGGGDRLAVWRVERDATWTWWRPVDNEGDRGRTVGKDVTAFTPATAVPTEALDVLREFQANSEHSRLIGDFLAAVDAANGGAA